MDVRHTDFAWDEMPPTSAGETGTEAGREPPAPLDLGQVAELSGPARRLSARWVAGAFLAIALLDLAGESLRLAGSAHGAGVSPLPSAAIGFVGVSMLVYLWVRFATWRLARGRHGERLLLSSAICGAVGPTVGLVPWFVLLDRFGPPPEWAIRWIEYGPIYSGTLFSIVATLLLAAGLLRSRLVARWVAWLGAGGGLLSVAGFVAARLSHPLPVWLRTGEIVIDLVFTAAIGLALWGLRHDESARTPSIRSVALVFGLVVAVAVALSVAAGVSWEASMSAYRAQQAASAAIRATFPNVFPGFGHEGDLPELGRDEPNMVESLTIKRAGRAVMQVEVTNGTSLVATEGPLHGKALRLAVPGPAWYLGDDYFVDHPDSAYASIPRVQKIALWDVFSAGLTVRERVIGVFTIAELHDRSLLAVDGYRPKDLDGATIVVSTPEFDSAVNEEVPWASADQLIVNARAYEAQVGQTEGGGTLDRLDVSAFTWSRNAWHAVPRRLRANGA